jgi:hypothetical protein
MGYWKDGFALYRRCSFEEFGHVVQELLRKHATYGH